MSASATIQIARMSVAEFLSWNPGGPEKWQLLDGEPVAMAPANRSHGALQGELSRLIGNHLTARHGQCSVVVEPGVVPRARSGFNVRVPDLAVTCSAYELEEATISAPVLIVEILSPSNEAETRANVWAYTTIPSVQEILVIRTTQIAAELLRRDQDGSWPESPEMLIGGDPLELASIGLTFKLSDAYATTRLAS